MQYETFGAFLKAKRMDKHISYRELAKMLNLSAPYISDIEKGRRTVLSVDKLEKLAVVLFLTTEERELMFDLAGKAKETIAPDIPEYIMKNDYVATALRQAKNLKATEKDWQAFIDELEKRKGEFNVRTSIS